MKNVILWYFGIKTQKKQSKLEIQKLRKVSEKLLGITFDKNLNFKKYIEDLCRNANQKIHALARLSSYIDPVKSEILMNYFISSQCNYCPLVWMFSNRATNTKLNRTFERAQRLVCKGCELKLKQKKENM